jgi:hypothetical protein
VPRTRYGRSVATDSARMVALFRLQARFCAEHGSPLYAAMLERVADDAESGGPAADVLAGHEDDPGPSALALRLMGAVHRLVLERRAPALAVSYPSVGGTAGAATAWPAFRDVLAEHRDEIRSLLDRPPQTNEVGRAAALAGALAHVQVWRRAPIRLVELGASGGLNLRVDRFRVQAAGGGGIGPVDSPLVLQDAWQGRLPPTGESIEVVARLGCDPDPVDPTTTDGRLVLTSYVWADQVERLERLRAAFEVAQHTPAEVVAERAEIFVRRLRLVPGTTTVVWHSVMRQYLTTGERAAVDDALDRLGATADDEIGLARVSLEPTRRRPGEEHEFLVRLRTWPARSADHGDSLDRVLGSAPPHGLPVTWE